MKKLYSKWNRNLPIKTVDVSIVKSNNLLANIMKLAKLHDILNNILDQVNKCYSIQVDLIFKNKKLKLTLVEFLLKLQAMFAFAVSFTFVVFSWFGVYRGWSSAIYEQFQFSIVLSIWGSYYLFFVINVLWAGHSSKEEVSVILIEMSEQRNLLEIFFFL